jgi:hypothetical protein
MIDNGVAALVLARFGANAIGAAFFICPDFSSCKNDRYLAGAISRIQCRVDYL